MTTLLAIMSVLAIWRATHMLQEEEGPFGVFSRLQAWAASQPDKVGGVNHGFFCFWCLSMWVAFPLAFLFSVGVGSFLLMWFALSAGAILIEQVSLKLDQ